LNTIVSGKQLVPNKDQDESKRKQEKKINLSNLDKHFPPLSTCLAKPVLKREGTSGRRQRQRRKRSGGGVTKSGKIHDLLKTMNTGSIDSKDSLTTLEPETSSIMAALVDQDTIYRFRLTAGPFFLASNGAGVTAGFETADPSGGGSWTASEWNNLTPLFTEVRLIEFKMRMFVTGVYDSNAWQGTNPTFVWNTSLTTPTAAPTSAPVVWDNASAKIVNVTLPNSREEVMTVRPRSLLNFASTSAPNPGSFAGCPGSINWYAENLPVSISWGVFYLEGFYEFRNRV